MHHLPASTKEENVKDTTILLLLVGALQKISPQRRGERRGNKEKEGSVFLRVLCDSVVISSSYLTVPGWILPHYYLQLYLEHTGK